MPKRVPKEDKRVPLNCLVSPETKRLLEELNRKAKISRGEAVDRAIAAWVKFRDANGIVSQTLTEIIAAPFDAMTKAQKRAPRKPETWKRGPRPKGDKTR